MSNTVMAVPTAPSPLRDQFFANFYRTTCTTCGRRRGLHRAGDEVCPNPLWRTGNGEPQWLERNHFEQTVFERSTPCL